MNELKNFKIELELRVKTIIKSSGHSPIDSWERADDAIDDFLVEFLEVLKDRFKVDFDVELSNSETTEI